MRTAVIGHVEWIEFAIVENVPAPGDIIHAIETFELPGGGAVVAAVQLAKLSRDATLYTVLADDELGRRARQEIEGLGVRVEATERPGRQRRCFVYLDQRGERTITTIGVRIGPAGADPLPWDELARTEAVYFTAGDSEALELARRTRVLVATTREMAGLAKAAVPLDAVVGSGSDPAERFVPGRLDPPPALVVATAGADGGTWSSADGRSGSFAAAPLPGPVIDAYGCGDSFAAGLTYALGAGEGIEEALGLAARCGAACLSGRGPFQGQLGLAG